MKAWTAALSRGCNTTSPETVSDDETEPRDDASLGTFAAGWILRNADFNTTDGPAVDAAAPVASRVVVNGTSATATARTTHRRTVAQLVIASPPAAANIKLAGDV